MTKKSEQKVQKAEEEAPVAPLAVEHGVPIPPTVRNQPSRFLKYPFRDLEVGDSFFVPREGRDFGTLQRTIISCAVPHRPKKFTVRRVMTAAEDGFRVWRLS